MSLLATTVANDEAPAPRRPWWRRVGAWALIGVAVAAGALVTSQLQPSWETPPPLAADSAAPDGAGALTSILREQGVEIETAARLDDAAELGEGATIVLSDTALLDRAALERLADAAAHLVLADADLASADALFPEIEHGGTATDELAPGCSHAIAERAGSITAGRLYRVADADVTACYVDGDAAALVEARVSGATVTLLDGAAVLTNEHLAEAGNAALAIGLAGRSDVVVWYTPSAADAEATGAPPTLAELAPAWVTPVMILLVLAAIAAMAWRGRRLGPLVAETLPVTVRASETLEGRARLYAHAHDPAHTAEALARGAVRRMARRLGLPREADDAEVATSAAGVTGRSPDEILALIRARPANDAELAEFGTRLRALESAVASADPWEGHRT